MVAPMPGSQTAGPRPLRRDARVFGFDFFGAVAGELEEHVIEGRLA